MSRLGDAVATRQSQVQGNLDSLEREVSMLRESITSLEQRLAVVLTAPIPVPPMPVPTGNKAQIDVPSALCPLANHLDGLACQLRSLGETVNDITQRCEC